MKVENSKYRFNCCDECNKELSTISFDIEIGEFVSIICPECMEKLRMSIDKKWREYMEEIDNF